MAAIKTKIVFDVTPAFRERWLRLCQKKHLDQVELFRQLVAKEDSEMTQYAGLDVSLAIHADDVLSDATGADVPLTAENYAERLGEGLEAEFPGATVRVAVRNGAGFGRLIVRQNGVPVTDSYTQQIEDAIERIRTRLLDNSEEWIVAQ